MVTKMGKKMNTIERKKAQRFQYLNLLYEKTEGNIYKPINRWEIGEELGWTKQTTDLVVQYLFGEKLAEAFTIGGGIVITHFGNKEIEAALTNPEEPTTYFPPTINVFPGNYNNSILNVDSNIAQSNQSIENSNFDQDLISQLSKLVEQLKIELRNIPIEQTEDAEIVVWAASELVKEQTQEKPNSAKMKVTKEGLKKAAENIATVFPNVLKIAQEIIQLSIS